MVSHDLFSKEVSFLLIKLRRNPSNCLIRIGRIILLSVERLSIDQYLFYLIELGRKNRVKMLLFVYSSEDEV